MAKKELKAKYLGSVLGIWWAVITPFLMVTAITFVFTKIIRIDMKGFPLFSLAGILPWFFFSISLSESTSSLLHKAQVLKQFTFPRIFIPVSLVLANFMNFLIGLLFVIPIFIFFNTKVLSALIALPLLLILHFLFTVGIGLVFSCLNIFFRDISPLLGIILMFWFWMTPVFYSLDMVPVSYYWLFSLNPMTVYIRLYQDILFRAVVPSLSTFLNTFFISSGILLAGWLIFAKNEDSFLKRI
jgi:ABC-2 type transport system permease protein